MTSTTRMSIALSPARRVSNAARSWGVPIAVGLGAYIVCVTFARGMLGDGDTSMHITIGRWILAHHTLPIHDPFSYTMQGHPWVPHEWLSEVVFAGLYDRFGWGGVVAGSALAIGAAFALLTHALEQTLGPRRAAIGAALAFLLSMQHLLARPHVLAWPLLVVWMAGIIRARDLGRTPSLWLLPVMVLWCNLHGGFVVGLAMAGLLAIEAVAQGPAGSRRAVIRGWGVFIGLAALGALISPNGINLYLLPLKMLGMHFAIANISEWQGANFTGLQSLPLEVWIFLATLGGFASSIRLPWSRLAIVLLLFIEALAHVRNIEFLGMVVPLLVAMPLARQLGPRERAVSEGAEIRERRSSTNIRAALALTVAIVLGFLATARGLDHKGIDPPKAAAPAGAVQAARAAGLTGHVFNSYRFGGYLIFSGIPVFIDGRADLYGDAFIKRFALATGGADDSIPSLLKQYAVAWAIFPPNEAAVAVLDHLPGWKRLYADKDAVVFRKVPAPQPAHSPFADPDHG